MRKYLALVSLLCLTACASGDVVRLSRNGQIVQCGPFSTASTGFVSTNLDVFGERKLQECIDGYEAQGYQPVDTASAAPNSQKQ